MKKPEWFNLKDNDFKEQIKEDKLGLIVFLIGVLILAFSVFKAIGPHETFTDTRISDPSFTNNDTSAPNSGFTIKKPTTPAGDDNDDSFEGVEDGN